MKFSHKEIHESHCELVMNYEDMFGADSTTRLAKRALNMGALLPKEIFETMSTRLVGRSKKPFKDFHRFVAHGLAEHPRWDF